MPKHPLTLLFVIFLLNTSAVMAQKPLLQPCDFNQTEPQSWLRELLLDQAANFTGILDQVGFPFTQGGWGAQPFLRTKGNQTYEFWVPYEQTAYYYDGMIRCGLLLHDKALTDKCRKVIYQTLKESSPKGLIGPVLSHGEMRRWPHALFFRVLMAEYESTHNAQIIQSLEHHFLNDTIQYEGRDLCNVETLCWLYQQTGNSIYQKKALQLLNAQVDKTTTLKGMFSQWNTAKRIEMHAVTFHEFLKLPVFYYALTGDQSYLKIARKAFAKLDQYNMLPDGVPSSEEGLSGNTSMQVHEMCNVVEYMGCCAYMLQATREVEWADRLEYALFNGGLGGITKNFDAHQYYSSPNQVICSAHSSPASLYDDSREAFRQIHRPPCCTGNLNRMLPLYGETQWLQDSGGSLYKALYGPGILHYQKKEEEITIKEESNYPFGDTIRIQIEKGRANLSLYLRIPRWCSTPQIRLNGQFLTGVTTGLFFPIQRIFKKGDLIELIFPKQAKYKQWNYESMTIHYGPLLFALGIPAEKKEVEIITPQLQKKPYKGYEITPTANWNYALGVANDSDTLYRVIERELKHGENPWKTKESPIRLAVPAYQIPKWQLIYHKIKETSGQESYHALTPPLPARGSMIYALNGAKPQVIFLEPYGRTLLRISMFPFWRPQKISAEILATDKIE